MTVQNPAAFRRFRSCLGVPDEMEAWCCVSAHTICRLQPFNFFFHLSSVEPSLPQTVHFCPLKRESSLGPSPNPAYKKRAVTSLKSPPYWKPASGYSAAGSLTQTAAVSLRQGTARVPAAMRAALRDAAAAGSDAGCGCFAPPCGAAGEAVRQH